VDCFADERLVRRQEREDVRHVYQLVKANQAEFAVRTLCSVLRVSASGYYDWIERTPSQRAQANAQLMQRISQVHRTSDATYGAPRIHAELVDEGLAVGKNRIARLMRLHGLRGVSRRRGWCVTTRRDKDRKPAPDLVQRRFEASGINQLWVADMTYIPTWAGFGYLAVVLDVFSRKVVGWAFGQRQTAELVLAALNMALLTRKPHGVIHHSDQGSQYTSLEFGRRCELMGVKPSMGSVGDAYDNAMAESFFASLECELIDRRSWPSFAQARMEIFTWIEGWYNPRRRHSGLGQKSPVNFERAHAQAAANQGPSLGPSPSAQDGLPNGCFAPVDKPPQARMKRPSACPQASPLDNPAPEHTHMINSNPAQASKA
jgi:putative transposase